MSSRHQVNGRVQLPEGTDPAGFFAFISKTAATGDAIAQYHMYVCYSRGIPGVVRKNEKTADRWLVRAGKNPDAPREALTDYGISLKYSSSHIQQDLVRAVQIFERAAHLGDSLATFHLAQMLNDGAGVPDRQPERALQLWKLVADGNREPIAPSFQPNQYLEGCEIPEAMYEYGSRCKEPMEKLHYLKMAAKKNLAKAQYELFCVLLQGPENVEVSQERRAAKWYRAAKRQGFVEKTPVIIDRTEDLCLEVVLLARMLRGGIVLRSLHLRKERVKELAASHLLSELEDDDED